MILLYFITPFLGCLRNYVKYKQLDFLVFMRTPIVYFLIRLFFGHDNVFQTLIYERASVFMASINESNSFILVKTLGVILHPLTFA